MIQLEQLFSQIPFVHHAYGIESSGGFSSEIESIIPRDQCSYIFTKTYDTFKIDDARAVKSLQSEKTEKASVFILEFSFINHEAQNALLKVLEEPTANTYFILVFPNARYLLPTLQSRLSLVKLQNANTTRDQSRLSASVFIAMNEEKRISFIKELNDKKQEIPLQKSEVLQFLNELESHFYHQKDNQSEILNIIFDSRKYLQSKGASMKMILENIALQI